MPVKTRVKKYTVCRMELKIKDLNGLYAFLPFECLDKNNKAVFKVGMTANDLQDRLENYHTYFPEGVYIVFFLSYDETVNRNMYKRIENQLFKQLLNNDARKV
jgi:T5orf172 domain